ncbi:hypothetical protein V8D89_011717 [Ganoderma adspersum]
MQPPPFFVFQHYEPEPSNPARKDERNAARAHLRDSVNGQLVRVSGRDDARVRWALRLFAKDVVDKLGFKFNDDPGWPSDIPFRDLNRIPGGIAVYRRLQSLVDTGRLRFVRATEEDRRNARLNPLLVSPNAADRTAALGIPSAPTVKLVHRITDLASRFQLPPPPSPPTTGVVLHPATMEPQFTFSVLPNGAYAQNGSDASSGSSAAPSLPARSQRSDVNKSRYRPVTNPDGRELRHPKRGPTTTKNIIEVEGIAAVVDIQQAIEYQQIILTDEDLAGCIEIGREVSGLSESQMNLDGEEEEIESADGWW